MNEDIKRHLWRIVEYLGPDEYRHWLEEGRSSSHIYMDVRAVAEWLIELDAGIRQE